MDKSKKTRNYIEPNTVRAYVKTMRVSADMIPKNLRGLPLWFMAKADKRSMTITLKPIRRKAENGNSHSAAVVIDGVQGHRLWSWYSASRGKSPYVPVGTLYKELGWTPPEEGSLVLKARVLDDGAIEVRLA